MLISVGTGYHPMTPERMPSIIAPAPVLAVVALRSLMEDCSWLGQTMLQFLGTSPSPWPIDSEVGDLADECLTPQPSLHYQRYDVVLSPSWLERHLGQRISANDIAQLAHIDRPALIPRLLELARIAAARQVQPDHLPRSFDRPPIDTPERPVPAPSQ